jgi:hypothetical protein
MRYFKGIPENLLRKSFQYDPDSPSGLARLRSRLEITDNASHIYKKKGVNSLRAIIMIDGKRHEKYFSFGRNGKSEQQAESEAHAFIQKTKNENPEITKTAGCKRKDGYWIHGITCNGKRIYFLAHRLVLFLCNENVDIEKKKIDHKDNNPSNNRKENLQIATSSQNCHNAKLSKMNTSGTKGLRDDVKNHRFHAQVKCNGKIHQKRFPYGKTPTKKHKAKIRAIAVKWLRETRERLHGDFTNHGEDE